MVNAELIGRFLWKCSKCNKEYKSKMKESAFDGAEKCCKCKY